ncbi:PLP-dependent aminotransferase family protein [Clostridium sp. MSJ-4]|uniref:PLP-dependent aminotransferase family protein n=1 Tax=Clostridium simiarum TaxID=2841506 RepID=A0ABS6F058_9CLOT|nr:PLP-dependent aminotransferase family protein [Clostridium simiarum]MBU5591686.1 PLP-dependent aminotransferase family protein [Clostridium simiarum]
MIYIQENSNDPMYLQIYRQIKDDIEQENIVHGERLPGIRTLAQTLGIGRNTVSQAYTQLAVEGYIQARHGSGFFVLDASNKVMERNYVLQDTNSLSVERSELKQPVSLYDFQYGGLTYEQFPFKLWRKYTSQILLSPQKDVVNQYPDKQGDLLLRQEIKKYLHRSRGMVCCEEQIIIGSGLHYSLDILCKILRKENNTIAMEEPGYNGARDVFINNNYNLYPIPANKDGLILSSIHGSGACAAYVTPSHQFPYGTVMPIFQRKELLNWAIDSDAYVIEDDYDSELRYDANPVPALHSLDTEDRTIYIGTFSKSLSPSLRVNYMVLPVQLLARYYSMFHSYNSPASWLTQRVLGAYMRDGNYEIHVRKMCLTYKRRHDVFVQEATKIFGRKVILHGRGAGLHFILEFPDGKEEEWLIKQAEKVGVKVYSMIPFWNHRNDCPRNIIFAGYSLLSEQQIREGIALLKSAWFSALP